MKKETTQALHLGATNTWAFLATHKGWRWLLIGLVVGFVLGRWAF
jgi:hypothetical protein